jgi:glutathione synthase/RimK-type ligase-like ATP-grasp enzyme
MSRARTGRVALASAACVAPRSDDDVALAAALGDLGVDASIVTWDDPAVDWTALNAVVIRSCWDYHLDPDRFLAWIASLEARDIRVLNDPATIRWNHSKSYLAELAAAGVTTVPTRWVERHAVEPLAAIIAESGWDDVVVKPAVSASAYGTWRSGRDASDGEREFRLLVDAGPVLVQPFMESVLREGEWSFMFIDGEYSHAVLKAPAPGDFRVQESHGGSTRLAVPPDVLVAEAHAALAAGPPGTLYARVDGCVEGGRLHLMELELIEPYLFLTRAPGAAARLAAALVERER